MGRFNSKFSDAQRDAIANALNVEGLTAANATTRARAGQLGDVSPFDMAESTAREIAARCRQQAPAGTARQRTQHQEQLLEAGLELMRRELDRLTEASNERPLTTQEVTRLSKMLRTMSDLAGGPASPPSRDEPQALAQPPRSSGVLERMLADVHQRQEFGLDPEDASVRGADTVEQYER